MLYEHPSIKVETPAPGRYQITGFPASTIFIPDVGHLAAPQIVDLVMSEDLADALCAVLNDYQPEKKQQVLSDVAEVEAVRKTRGRQKAQSALSAQLEPALSQPEAGQGTEHEGGNE